MTDHPSPDEELLARWVREAGDPSVAPQPQHAETLRAEILDRAIPAARPRLRAKLRAALILVGTAVLVLAGVFIWSQGSQTSWAQVVAAVRAKPWIHATVNLPNGTRGESWMSPTAEVWGSCDGDHAEFVDYRAKTRYAYDAKKKILLRTPESDAGKRQLLSFQDLLEALLRGDHTLNSPFPGMELVSQKRSNVVDGGKAWFLYELVLGSDAIENRLLLRVDPQTLLLQSMTVSVPNDDRLSAKLEEARASGKRTPTLAPGGRMTVTMAFDYPDHGPADIYALGVPRSTPLEDRVPTGELARLIDGVNSSREKFPQTYLAIVTHAFGTAYLPAPEFVWRKGTRWRREYHLPVAGTPEERKAINALKLPPAGTDMVAWWKKTTQGWRVQPMEFCDGNAIYGDVSKTMKTEWKKLYQGVWFTGVIQKMLPELHGYPHLSASLEGFTVEMQTNPKDGPAGTVLLIRRSTVPKGTPLYGQVYRFWIDPQKSFLVVRQEWNHPDPQTGEPKSPDEVWIIDGAAQAPNGIWYPTVVRRKGAVHLDGKEKPVDEIWSFYVDFKAEVPDELFRPELTK